MIEDSGNQILREQIRLAMEQLPAMQVGALVVALVLCYMVRDAVPLSNIFGWFTPVILIIFSSVLLYKKFSRVREGLFASEPWKNAYLLLALISGIFWGLSAFIIFPAGHFKLIFFLILVIGTVAGTISISHSAVRFASSAWIGSCGLFYVIRFVKEGGEFGYTISFLIILFILTVLSYSFKYNKFIITAISLRFQNLALLEEVRKINDSLCQKIAELKIAQETLRQSEEKFRLIFQTSPEGISLTRLSDGMCLDINEGFSNITGYTRDDVVGKTSLELNVWYDLKDRERFVTGLKGTGFVENLEAKFCGKDGKIIIGLMSACVLQINQEDLVLSITRDITGRKKTELALQKSNARSAHLNDVLRAILDVSGVINTRKEPLELLDAVCSSVVKTRGYVNVWIGQPEAGSKRVLPVARSGAGADFLRHATITWDDSPTGREPAGTAMRERRPVVIDDLCNDPCFAPWKDPVMTYGAASIASVPLLHHNRLFGVLTVRADRPQAFDAEEVDLLSTLAGNVARALQSLEDEEAVIRAKKDWERTFDAVPDLIAILDKDYRIVRANRAMANKLGLTPGECVGLRCSQCVHGTDDPPSFCPNRQLLIDGREHAAEIHEERLGGDFSVSVSPLFNAAGKLTGSVHVCRDITEGKRAEKERRRLEEHLQRAEKMEALGTLAGGVAHDLNNVLGVVVGYSELLLYAQDESSSVKSKAAEILKAGQKAAAIVQDLLTLARRGIQDRKPLNLNKVLLESQRSPEFAKVLSYHPNIVVDTNLEMDLLNISGSPVHLEKSFMNLVSNAAEAMPGGGTLTIKTLNQYLDEPIAGYDTVREGDYVVLSVSDTGEGISAADLKRIFEPFYTKKVMGRSGTGLGLAVVWCTVKDHYGYINVESEEGKGTTVALYFPVTREDVIPEKTSISAAEYMGDGESILIVDDVKEQRELATAMLAKLNYRAASVPSGEGALEYLKQYPVDLVVLDMIMDPGMDGLDTYRKILEIHPKQKAIIVSGFSETERVGKAQALGAGAYVKKPYVLEKLGLAVKKELHRST